MTQPFITRFEMDGPGDTGLADWDRIDPAGLAAGEPVQRGHVYHADEAAGYLAGVWDCTAQTEKMGPYAVDEFMFLLDGELVMVLPDGSEVLIEAGQGFVIPKGLECQWKQTGYLRKFFMILDAPVPASADNPSLHRIVVPDLAQTPNGIQGAVSVNRTDFMNAGGAMRVGVSHMNAVHIPERFVAENRLIHVLSGQLVLAAGDGVDTFDSGETAYVRQGGKVSWKTEAETRLLWSTYRQD